MDAAASLAHARANLNSLLSSGKLIVAITPGIMKLTNLSSPPTLEAGTLLFALDTEYVDSLVLRKEKTGAVKDAPLKDVVAAGLSSAAERQCWEGVFGVGSVCGCLSLYDREEVQAFYSEADYGVIVCTAAERY